MDNSGPLVAFAASPPAAPPPAIPCNSHPEDNEISALRRLPCPQNAGRAIRLIRKIRDF